MHSLLPTACNKWQLLQTLCINVIEFCIPTWRNDSQERQYKSSADELSSKCNVKVVWELRDTKWRLMGEPFCPVALSKTQCWLHVLINSRNTKTQTSIFSQRDMRFCPSKTSQISQTIFFLTWKTRRSKF